MARNQLQVQAAEFYAREHGMSAHQAFRDKTFQRMWNDFLKHPYNPSARKTLGLNRRLRTEGEAEEKTFRKHEEIWGNAKSFRKIGATTMESADVFYCNSLLHDFSKISGLAYVWIAPTDNHRFTARCLTMQVPEVENELEPIFRGLLLGHVIACLEDDNKMRQLYASLVAFGLPIIPMFTTVMLEEENISIYMFIPIPHDIREKDYEVWMDYSSHHIRQRIRHEDACPTGTYVDWAVATTDYVSLLSDLILNPNNADVVREIQTVKTVD